MTVGDWSALRELNDDDRKVFDSAFSCQVGVKYEPLLVETQVVAGLNYRFICNATPVVAEPETYAAVVTVWSKADGSVLITDINMLNNLI